MLDLEVNVVNSFKRSYGTDFVEDSEFFGDEETERTGEIKNMYTYPVLRHNEDLLEEGADLYASKMSSLILRMTSELALRQCFLQGFLLTVNS